MYGTYYEGQQCILNGSSTPHSVDKHKYEKSFPSCLSLDTKGATEEGYLIMTSAKKRFTLWINKIYFTTQIKRHPSIYNILYHITRAGDSEHNGVNYVLPQHKD